MHYMIVDTFLNQAHAGHRLARVWFLNCNYYTLDGLVWQIADDSPNLPHFLPAKLSR